jgi:ribose 1,5-bisphosphokinase
MNWLMRLLNVDAAGRIGPGRLVLVVGPSGAGKDTLIDAARAACRTSLDIVFPRRVITRPSSAAEDHDTLAEQAFDQAATEGAFAIWWEAHGLRYGIPRAIDAELQAGRTVVCNVSRTVVRAARERYAHVAVVLVTAPPDVLAARLAGRGRSSDGNVAQRVGRVVAVESELKPDFTIENVGTVDQAARRLLSVLTGQELVLGL